MKMIPKLKKYISDKVFLWFEQPNRYLITDPLIYEIIKIYSTSENNTVFLDKVHHLTSLDIDQIDSIYRELDNQFKDFKKTNNPPNYLQVPFDIKQRKFSIIYDLGSTVVKVYYSNSKLKSFLHPPLAHLVVHNNDAEINTVFDVQIVNHCICFFQNKKFIQKFEKNEPHLLQGKFNIRLLSAIHNNTEQEWIASLHASSIASGEEAVLIIGKSGQGKSTFTSHLMASGYDFVADDLTPLKSNDLKVYPHPTGISIKQGAFESLHNKIPNFDRLPTTFKNVDKGNIKYIPPKTKITDYTKGYDVKKIVVIQYQPESTTSLKPIEFDEALNVLIPDSWISPHECHARQFMDWISQLEFFSLRYSKTTEAIKRFETILKP